MSSKDSEEKKVKKRSHSQSRSKSEKVEAEEKDVKKRSHSKSRSSPEKSKSSSKSDHHRNDGKTVGDKDKSRDKHASKSSSSSKPEKAAAVEPVIRDRSREKSRPPKIYTDEEKMRLKRERQAREAKRELEKSSKSEKKEQRQQPRIVVDKRVAADRKPTKIESSSAKANLLPDKNVMIKLKQQQQLRKSTSKSSVDESSGSSKARVSTRVKAESSSKKKYDEKRGQSSVFAPPDAANKLKDSIKANTESRRKKKVDSSDEKTTTTTISRERRRSRTLSPSEVRVLNHNNNAVKEQKEASPSGGGGAAADSVVDKNLRHDVDPPAKNESDNSEIDFNHLEEFEDYESDVDDFTIATQVNDDSDVSLLSLDLEPIILKTEEKRKLVVSAATVRREREQDANDSEHRELAETRKRAAMVESLMAHRMRTPSPEPEMIKLLASEDSYRGEKQTESKSLASADEGFEDAKSGDFAKSSPRVSQINLVNAEKSRPEKIIEEPTKKTLTRGQVLMSMIKLDTVEFSLYEAHPISYDEYIRTYGKLNSQQTYTQTNEDNLDVEIQTVGIELENKWTQFPVRCRGSLESHDDVRQFKLDHLGCGGDAPDQASFFAAPSYDVLGLTEFLERAGKLVLALLEEREMGGDVLGSDTRDFPFSEGCVKLATGSISFLAGRQVRRLCYAESNHKILASVHESSREKFQLTDKQDYIKDCCVGCVWNINEPSRPTKMFYSPSPVTSCCFHCTNNNIVFAGNQDGSICLWDLREDETWHQRISDKSSEMDWIVRSSTYTTAGDSELSHSSTVVAIGTLLSAANLDSGQEEGGGNDGFFNIQLCSLDEDGRLIIWSVIRNLTQQQQQRNASSSSSSDKDLGLAQWGRVRLVKSQEIATKRLEVGGVAKCFVDMAVDQADSDNLYLAVNDTNVLYVNCAGGGRNSTPFYRINEMDSCGSTTCLEVFPFKRSYFLAGCKDGSIRLHSLHAETPLMKLKDEDSLAGIRSIQWSRSRPTIFYVLDDQSRIAVWDMLKSATKPIHVVATTSWESVKCIKLSPCNVERDKQNQYMAIGTYGGNVEVHKLKRDFYFSKQEDMQREMDAFLEFVSIL